MTSNDSKSLTRDALSSLTRNEVEAELLRRSFREYTLRFWPVVTGAPLTWNRAIEQAVGVLQMVADGSIKRLCVAMPSGVGKSTLLVLYKSWRLARNPAHRVIAMMHASSLAATESLRIRRLIESEEYRTLFPAVQMRPDEQRVEAWATTLGGAHFAVGVDTSLLGRRAHEAVLDDPLDTLDRFSRAAKERLWVWFSESLATRLDGDRAPITVVHQRTAVDDLIGRLMEQRNADGSPAWFLLELPAEYENGELLAPTVLTREKLDELKYRNPRAYAAMFLQRPSADDGAAIARTAWRFHAPASANANAERPFGCAKPDDSPTLVTPAAFDRTVISCDPTFGGTKSSNDFCSIQVWGATGAWRVLRDRWKKKAKQLEQREQLKVFRAAYPDATILIERAAGGDGMIEELEAEGFEDVVGVTVGTMTGGKSARLENVSPGIERGEVLLPIGMHDLAGFIEELAGATRNDDCIDACSQALHWLNVQQSDVNQAERWRGITAGLRSIARRAISGITDAGRDTPATDQAARDAEELPADQDLAATLEPQLQMMIDAFARGTVHAETLSKLEHHFLLCRRVRLGIASRSERAALRRFVVSGGAA